MKTIEVVAAIIQKDNRFLAMQRRYGDFAGNWEFPGGKIELDETLQDALVREIKEELDADISVDELIGTVDFDYPKFHLTMHCFLCTLASEHVLLLEHEAAKWLAPEELDSVEWLPADLEIVKILRGT